MIKAIAITGPTASGKTALSVKLAKELGTEIVSCDSMQIYKGMDIGTAKATEEERMGVPHHMIDVVSPADQFSAKDYKETALPIIERIWREGKTPIIVGGTGLYLDTLIRETSDLIPGASAEYREAILSGIKTEEDKIALHKRLEAVDGESAAAIHYNNVKRVIRALEICETTGKPKSYFDKLSKSLKGKLDPIHITIDFRSRELLYERIDKRVDKMVDEGLFREVEELRREGLLTADTTAGCAIGYKEIILGEPRGDSRGDIISAIKKASRNYAKRQLTWFRHSEGANVIYADTESGKEKSFDEIYAEALSIIKSKQ